MTRRLLLLGPLLLSLVGCAGPEHWRMHKRLAILAARHIKRC